VEPGADTRAAALEYLRRAATPVDHLDPEGPLDDLGILDQVVGGARVVEIGESLHAAREFGRLRHRMTRYLVENLGFDTVCFETGLVEATLVNRYVQGEDIPEADVRDGFTYGFGHMEDVFDLVRWLRRHNAGGASKVTFHGVDLPGSVRTPLPALEALVALSHALPTPGAGARLQPILDAYRAAPVEPHPFVYFQLALDDQREFLQTLRELEDDATREVPQGYAARCVANARASIEAGINVVVAGNTDDVDPEVRDGHMAENVLWLMEQEPGARLVVLAANGHIQRFPMYVRGEETPLRRGMGQFLGPALGDQLVAIGSGFGWLPEEGMPMAGLNPGMFDAAADPDSIDALLGSVGPGHFIADLRGATGDAREWLEGRHSIRVVHMYPDTRAIPAFDAMYYIDRLTNSAWA
jgi:erythromycin esterase